MGTILILAALAGTTPEQCRRIHYTTDGRVIETTVSVAEGGASALSSAHGSNSSSSSVSVSSSSNGTSRASTTASSNGVHRSTSMRRDANGCTITVDDRSNKE